MFNLNPLYPSDAIQNNLNNVDTNKIERVKSQNNKEINKIKEKTYFKAKLYQLLETTTCNGIPNIVRAKNRLQQFIWLILYLASLTYATYTTIIMFLGFLEFNVLIKFKVVQEFNSLSFPTISFCNLSPFDFSNKTNLATAYEFYSEFTNFTDKYYFFRNNQSLCSTESKEDIVSSFTYTIDDLYKYGMSLEKMLIKCIYNNEPCNIQSDFTEIKSSTFGRCYAFNFAGNLSVKRAGIYNGLELELFIGENEYQPCWQAQRGIAIVLHNNNYKPHFNDEALKIQPGIETNVILSRTDYQKLGFPYSDCVDPSKTQKSESVKRTIEMDQAYTQKRCIRNCVFDMNQESNKDGCLKNSKNKTYFACLNNPKNITKFYQICSENCPIECQYSVFNLMVLNSEFPSENYAEFLKLDQTFYEKFTFRTNANESKPDLTLDRIKKNILRLNVYFSDMNVLSYSEQPESNFNELLANLGGQLGLFLGLSMLSFCEVLDFLFLFVEFLISKTYLKKSLYQDRTNGDTSTVVV